MYEAPEIISMGAAHDLILGQKPIYWGYMDSEGLADRFERQTDDIDEVDE
jgi:hypothetical protein